MEWLRCNKCYDHFGRSSQNFSVIKCGHVFCEGCWMRAASKCPECGIVSFDTLTLTKPPKLETVVNYFSPATHFTEQGIKAMEFHDQQLAISLRGLETLEKKYNRGKRCYEDSNRALKIEYDLFKKKVESAKMLEASIKAFGTQSLSKRGNPAASHTTNEEILQTPKQYMKYSQQNGATNTNRKNDNVTVRHLESSVRRENFRGCRSVGAKWNALLESSSGNSSNCETPRSIHQDGFVVPTMTKVPKSVGGSRARTLPRLSDPKV